ncbi:MAG: hypothetical protein IPI67_22715 [Myxococcales bacterium]|nr:hypothetical protein [Myxococcales bacterium]
MKMLGARVGVAVRLGLGAAVALLWAAACGSDDAEGLRRGKLAEGCVINTDCTAPLVCAFRLCHQECKDQPDCELGQLCVPADKPFNVCQLPIESGCTYHSQCPADFRCAAGKCRPECVTEKDCVGGQACVTGVCAAKDELVDGGLVTDGGTDSSLGVPCVYSSNCTAPLVCINGSCLPECQEDRDCPLGQVCNAAKACAFGGGSDAGADGADGAVGPSDCSNGKQDPTETGIDCGGPCGACADSACTKPSDCASHVCSTKKCQAPNCTDGLQNGTESDIDCGGASCSKCGAQKGCWGPLDCGTGNCTGGVCIDLSCSDKVKGGAETDVDCGGPLCSPCADGSACDGNNDCTSANCVSKKCVPPGPTTWTEVYTIGGSNYVGARVSTDPSGSVFAAGSLAKGTFGGTLLQSVGYADLFIAKYKPSGASEWAVRAGGAGDESIVGMGTDSAGNILMAGLTSAKPTFGTKTLTCDKASFYVAKYAGTNGTNMWANCIETGTGTLTAYAAGVDSGGDLFVAGQFSGVHDFQVEQLTSAVAAGFVAKFAAATGDPVWVKQFAVPTFGYGFVRALVADGADMILTGDFYGSDVTFGTTTLTNVGGNTWDIFLVKVSATGAFSSAVRYGDAGDDRVGGMARTASGKLVLTGEFAGQVDFGKGPLPSKGGSDAFLMEVDPSTMTTTWAKGFGSSADDRGVAVASAPNGEIALAAEMGAAANFGGGALTYVAGIDLVVARYSSSGTHLSSKSWGGLLDDRPDSITWSGPFVAVVGTYSSGLINFGNGNLPATGENAYIAHFGP